jgi:hypothetical protein
VRLTVACVLWVGDFEGRHYSPAWVYRLRDQVAAHLPLAHRFVCLSNVDVPGVETIPLVTGWPGWWAKVEIFNPALDLGNRVVYLDLDVFVTGDLTPIARFPFPLALMPASHVFGTLRPRKLPGVVRRYQASCIAFDPPHGRDLFERCDAAALTEFRSDQDWIGAIRPSCPTFPAAWFAKAKQCRDGVPPAVKVVLAHRVNLVGRTLEEVAAA